MRIIVFFIMIKLTPSFRKRWSDLLTSISIRFESPSDRSKNETVDYKPDKAPLSGNGPWVIRERDGNSNYVDDGFYCILTANRSYTGYIDRDGSGLALNVKEEK